MFISHHQTEEQDHDMKVANMPFENVTEIKCLGTKVTKFCIHKEVTFGEFLLPFSSESFVVFCAI
jgi:hypothetical protein